MSRVHRRLLILLLLLATCFVLAFSSTVTPNRRVKYATLATLIASMIATGPYLNAYRHQMNYQKSFQMKPPSTAGERLMQEGRVLERFKALAGPARRTARTKHFVQHTSAHPITKFFLLREFGQRAEEDDQPYLVARAAAIYFGFREIPEDPEQIFEMSWLLPRSA